VPVPRPCSPLKPTADILGNSSLSYNSPKKQINYNEYEEGQFNDFLRKLMMAESQIEDAKVSLALRTDFNCEDAFRIFELNGRGFIDECDLKCGLNLIGIFPTDHEIRLLMKRFDLQKQGVLNFADFFDMLVPFEKEYRAMVENRCPNTCCPCRCTDAFCYSTLCSLKNVFNLIINLENDINNNRKLFGTLRLKLKDIFGLLDYPRRGYFSNNDLIVYLQKNGIYSNNKDADLLFIRLDKARNGNVYYNEVEDELQTLY
jgi:Ca2+-binding EF-hand superfamily protein